MFTEGPSPSKGTVYFSELRALNSARPEQGPAPDFPAVRMWSRDALRVGFLAVSNKGAHPQPPGWREDEGACAVLTDVQ